MLLEGGALDRAVNFLAPYSWGVAEAVAIASDLVQRSGEATRGLDDGEGGSMNSGRSCRSVESCSPWRNAFSASDSHSDHSRPSPWNRRLAPLAAIAMMMASDNRVGVGESLVNCRRSGSWHPIKTLP